MEHLSAKAPNIPTELTLLNCSDPGFSLSIPAHIANVSPFFPGEGRCVRPTPWLMNVKWKEVEKRGGLQNFKNSPGEIKSCFNLLCSWLIHDSGKWGREFDQTVTKCPHFKFLCFLWEERKKKSLLTTMETAFLLYTVASSLQTVTLGRPLWRYSP